MLASKAPVTAPMPPFACACGGESELSVSTLKMSARVFCCECGLCTALYRTPEEALARWNALAEMAAKARAGEAVYVYLRDQHTPEMSLARQFMEAALAEELAKAGLT